MGPRPPEERDGRETHATEGLGMGFRARSAAIPCRRALRHGFPSRPAGDRPRNPCRRALRHGSDSRRPRGWAHGPALTARVTAGEPDRRDSARPHGRPTGSAQAPGTSGAAVHWCGQAAPPHPNRTQGLAHGDSDIAGPAPRPLPHHRAARHRRLRVGPGVLGRAPAAARGREVPAAGRRGRRGVGGGRGPGRGPRIQLPHPPQHRHGPRLRRGRPLRLHRHGVRGRRDPRRAHGPGGGRRPHLVRGGPRAEVRGRGTGLRPRQRRPAPGHQARERHGGPGRLGEARRLRHGLHRQCRRLGRGPGRHRGLHAARAARRRPRGRAHRRLRPGRRLLRGPHRHAALRGQHAGRLPQAHREGRAAALRHPRTRPWRLRHRRPCS